MQSLFKSFSVLVGKLEDSGLLWVGGVKDTLWVVENLEGRRKGSLEVAEKTSMDFYNYYRILGCLYS